MPYRWHLERHVHYCFVTQLDKAIDLDITVNLGVLLVEGVVDYVSTDELRTILVIPVSNEDGNIVHPDVAWRSAEKNPLVSPGNSYERLCPGSTTHNTLFVKYEERILNLRVLA